MTTDPVIQRLQHLAVQRFGDIANGLKPDADFFEALGIDSLQALDLLSDLEDAFDIEVPDYELQGVRTLTDLAHIIGRRL